MICQRKKTKSDFVQIKQCLFWENTGTKCLQIIYLIKDLYPKYIKHSKLDKKANNAIKMGKVFKQRCIDSK